MKRVTEGNGGRLPLLGLPNNLLFCQVELLWQGKAVRRPIGLEGLSPLLRTIKQENEENGMVSGVWCFVSWGPASLVSFWKQTFTQWPGRGESPRHTPLMNLLLILSKTKQKKKDREHYADLFTVYLNVFVLVYLLISLIRMHVFFISSKLGPYNTGSIWEFPPS